MSYFSQSGHETMGNRASILRYLLYVTVDIWNIFEDQGDMLAFEKALDLVLLRNQGPETGALPRGEPQPHSQHNGSQ